MPWAPPYITPEALAAYLRIGDDVDETEMIVAIEAASRAIDDHCNRQFGQVEAEERRYRPWWDSDRCRWVVDIDDLTDPAGLETDLAGWTLEPTNAASKGRAYTRLVADDGARPDAEVAFTQPWGWSAVPVQVEMACRLQASRFHARRDSPYGVAGSPDLGSEMRLLARLDPDVGMALRGLVRPRAVG